MTFMIIAWSRELFKYKIKCSKTRCTVDGWASPSCASNLSNSIKSLKRSLPRPHGISEKERRACKESMIIYLFFVCLFVSFALKKPVPLSYRCLTTLSLHTHRQAGEGVGLLNNMAEPLRRKWQTPLKWILLFGEFSTDGTVERKDSSQLWFTWTDNQPRFASSFPKDSPKHLALGTVSIGNAQRRNKLFSKLSEADF